jgi:hypothetical protein
MWRKPCDGFTADIVTLLATYGQNDFYEPKVDTLKIRKIPCLFKLGLINPWT